MTGCLDRVGESQTLMSREATAFAARPAPVDGSARAQRPTRCRTPCRWRGCARCTRTRRRSRRVGVARTFTDVDGHDYIDLNVGDMSMILGFAPPLVVDGRLAGGRERRPFPVAAGRRDRRLGTAGSAYRPGLLAVHAVGLAGERRGDTARARGDRSRAHRDLRRQVSRTCRGDDGRPAWRRQQYDEALGLAPGATRHTRVLPFNDIDAVERELASR